MIVFYLSNTYAASMTTATPTGCKASEMAIAICFVRRSWTVINKINSKTLKKQQM